MKYTIDSKKRSQFIWAFLLDQVIDKRDFNVYLTGNDAHLIQYFSEMLSLGFVKVENHFYKIDTKGQEFVDVFFAKYKEFLKFYDIFCAVDLTEGTFAFDKFFDFETDEEWKKYLNQDNWEDVRVAVCEFKKIDPLEIVFLSLLNEGRFSVDNWQMELTSMLVWDEVENICNTAISLDSLSQDGVIEDIVQQGSDIMLRILQDENKRKLEELKETTTDEEYEEEVVIVEEETVYYEQYVYDPYYVSPCWLWYY